MRIFSANRPKGLRSHGIRPRTLASEVGDVSFSRRYRDECGCDVYPSPTRSTSRTGRDIQRRRFLVEAAARRLALREGGEAPRGNAPPSPADRDGVHATSALRREEGGRAVAPTRDGVVPRRRASKELCMWRPDGTYFSVQGAAADDTPKRLEVRRWSPMRAKEEGRRKVQGKRCAHRPRRDAGALWSEAWPPRSAAEVRPVGRARPSGRRRGR